MEGCSVIVSPSPPWVDLPVDLTANILHRLGAVEIIESAQKVCTTWWRVCRDPTMWRVVEIKYRGVRRKMPDLMLRHIVDRSQGELIDITLEDVGNDVLLNYICERSRDLKRLSIAYCNNISTRGLSEAVKKIPQLEELHLTALESNFYVEIESIGNSCSMLKSFSYNEYRSFYTREARRNAYALAIAKSMPNLRHLRLFANAMKNEGLEAILDGCPHLESLDLRRCVNLNLREDLGKRLSRQIKSLKRPSDAINGYERDMLDICRAPRIPGFYSSDFESYLLDSPLGAGYRSWIEAISHL